MKITIFGTGYVWLVTGVCLAEVWNEVLCIDIDQEKIKLLNSWIIPIYEQWLEELVIKNKKEKRLIFSTDFDYWVDFSNVLFSCVWTPEKNDGSVELKYIKKVAEVVWKKMKDYKIFINKSTVPVGTWDICKDIIQDELIKRWLKINFDIASNPEFLKEWSAIKDFMSPDRIVCWVNNEKSKKILTKIYSSFIRSTKPLIFVDLITSELVKYSCNAFLATKISFINEIANFSELVWANIKDISKCMWFDDRIWSRFLHAWIWYWGSCLPKDISWLIKSWQDENFDFKILKAVTQVNNWQKNKVFEKLHEKIEKLDNKNITLWWLSFKPKTDDIRLSPSINLIKKLLETKVDNINLYDPVSNDNIKKIWFNEKRINYFNSNYESIKYTDALILLTEWDEFRDVDFEKIKKLMKWNLIIDWRNIWNKNELEWLWFIYEWIWI